MIVTVLWEDRAGVVVKDFGPQQLLLACIADDLGVRPQQLRSVVEGIALKGNTHVRKCLKENASKWTSAGPLLAVVEWDHIRDLWTSEGREVPSCMTGIWLAFLQDAPGTYELVFLVDNVDTLVAKTCKVLDLPMPAEMSAPNDRDRMLIKAANGPSKWRAQIRAEMASFDRLVKHAGDMARAVLAWNSLANGDTRPAPSLEP